MSKTEQGVFLSTIAVVLLWRFICDLLYALLPSDVFWMVALLAAFSLLLITYLSEE